MSPDCHLMECSLSTAGNSYKWCEPLHLFPHLGPPLLLVLLTSFPPPDPSPPSLHLFPHLFPHLGPPSPPSLHLVPPLPPPGPSPPPLSKDFASFFCLLRAYTSAYLFIPLHTSSYLCIPLHTSAYLFIPLHTSSYLCVSPQTVQNYMQTSCSCHGISGSCTIQTCWRQLPEVGVVGDVLRQKYNAAAMVRVGVPPGGGPASLYYADSGPNPVVPMSSEIVYLEPTVDYCSLQSNYTLNRYCVPRSNMTSYLSGYYSACEDLCCNGKYITLQRTRTYSCNCKFIWCCNVVCSTCTETVVQYMCTG